MLRTALSSITAESSSAVPWPRGSSKRAAFVLDILPWSMPWPHIETCGGPNLKGSAFCSYGMAENHQPVTVIMWSINVNYDSE